MHRYMPGKRKAVHVTRHLDVRKQQGHLVGMLLEQLDRLIRSPCFVEAEPCALEDIASVHEDERVVVDDKGVRVSRDLHSSETDDGGFRSR